MLKKICEVCGKEEIVCWDDYIYYIALGSHRIGYEEVDDAKEIEGKETPQQSKEICEECIKKLGFTFNKEMNEELE